MTRELQLLAAARPQVGPTPGQVCSAGERRDLFERITALAPAEQADTTATEHAAWIDLVSPRGSRAARRTGLRRLLPVLAAVATAVAVAIGIAATHWSGGSPSYRSPAGGGQPVDPRSLPFRLDSGSGLQIVSVGGGSEPGVQEIQLNAHYKVDLLAPGVDIAQRTSLLAGVTPGDPVPGLNLVQVNGAPGYYGEFADTSRATPGSADYPPNSLVWQYAPDSWAWLLSEGVPDTDTEARLLDVARAMDFAHSTPVSTPIKLSAAPMGMPLTYLNIETRDRNGLSLSETIDYALENGDGIDIDATTLVSAGEGQFGGEPLTVNGRPAYWNADQHQLTIDAGNGLTLVVVESLPGTSTDYTFTREQLIGVAETITVVPDPTDRSSWFDAEQAIP